MTRAGTKTFEILQVCGDDAAPVVARPYLSGPESRHFRAKSGTRRLGLVSLDKGSASEQEAVEFFNMVQAVEKELGYQQEERAEKAQA